MTRTPDILGSDYDAPAQLAAPLYIGDAGKRARVLGELKRAEAEGDSEKARFMRWELGLLDIVTATANGVSAYRGATYEKYAEFYHLTPETAAYARERANETQDLILKIHYLEYALLRMDPTGREWIDAQRELLRVYKDYVNGCRAGAGNDRDCHTGVYIEHALKRMGELVSRRGVIPVEEQAECARWLVQMADDSRSFPVHDPTWVEQQRHRWIADYLWHLTELSPEAVDQALRERAIRLLQDAAAFYESTPLNDNFAQRGAEVDAALRKYWGETGTHEQMIRKQFQALIRRATLHKETGNGLLTATFLRQARSLVEEHRQYFSNEEVATLQREERQSLDVAVEGGEFKSFHYSIDIPADMMDFTRETAEATVNEIVAQSRRSVPNRARLREEIRKANADAPLQAIIPRAVIGPGKVVAESRGAEENLELDLEQRVTMRTKILGVAIAHSLAAAASKLGLTADHLMAPVASLHLDEGTSAILRHGFERLIAGDHISATHILIPHTEDVLRQRLEAAGVDTTDYRDLGDGTSRTDDATLGSLMHKSLADGRSVKEYLGEDMWDHLNSVLNSQVGLNLRNEFGHGLVRPQHCTPDISGIGVSILYLLAGEAESPDVGSAR